MVAHLNPNVLGTKDQDARRDAAPEIIVEDTQPDVVFFQEVWGNEQREKLAAGMRAKGYGQCISKSDIPEWDLGKVVVAAPALLGAIGAGMTHLTSRFCSNIFSKIESKAFRNIGRWARNASYGLNGVLGVAGTAVLAGADQQLTRDYGNGLLICVKDGVSIEPYVDSMYFKGFDTVPPNAPEEAFIYKGAIKATIEIRGKKIDVFNTHLGARRYVKEIGKYDPGDTEAVGKQMKQLADWIREHRTPDYQTGKPIPMLLVGDFNLNPLEIENGKRSMNYSPHFKLLTNSSSSEPAGLGLLDSMAAVHGFTDPPMATDGPMTQYAKINRGHYPPEEIDRAFSSEMLPIEASVVFKKDHGKNEETPKFRNLSDHWGIRVKYKVPVNP